MGSLQDKVAIVSGASAGIGRAAALLFAREGARVVIGARRQAELDTLVAEIRAFGAEAEAVVGDARDESYAKAVAHRAVALFGRLDVGFNNVGGMTARGPSAEFALADWNAMLELNLNSAFLGAKHQLPPMVAAGAGSIIFSSSYVGTAFGFPEAAAYSTSKAGLIGLTKALASEFGPRGVRVNALVPGSVDTPAMRAEFGSPEQQGFLASLHALKRIADADEIARAALFLASDASSFVTGSSLVADGGAGVTRV